MPSCTAHVRFRGKSGHHSAVYLCLLLTRSVLCTAECSLRFIGIPLRRPCAASLQRCQRNSFGAPARSRTCSQGARPPQTLSPCSWLVLLPVMAASQGFSQRLSLAKQDGGGKRSQLISKWSAGYLTGSLWSRRDHACECPFRGVKRTWLGPVAMSANDPKRTLAK